MTAPLRERLEKKLRNEAWTIEGRPTALNPFGTSSKTVVRLNDALSILTEALAELAEREKDAERYRWLQLRMRGEKFASGRQYFDVDFPDPLTNIMQGSVAEHFNDAIDAAIKEKP